MLVRECPAVVFPDRALCLPTFSHLLSINFTLFPPSRSRSLSRSLALALILALALALAFQQCLKYEDVARQLTLRDLNLACEQWACGSSQEVREE
jgi:hypothetical protein